MQLIFLGKLTAAAVNAQPAERIITVPLVDGVPKPVNNYVERTYVKTIDAFSCGEGNPTPGELKDLVLADGTSLKDDDTGPATISEIPAGLTMTSRPINVAQFKNNDPQSGSIVIDFGEGNVNPQNFETGNYEISLMVEDFQI